MEVGAHEEKWDEKEAIHIVRFRRDSCQDMMLEQQIATIERKLGISPPESLWLRTLRDDKLNPDKLMAMKHAMNIKY